MLQLLALTLGSRIFGSVSGTVQKLMLLRSSAQINGNIALVNWCSRCLQRYSIFVAAGAVVDPTVRFPHPTGIVIGNGVRVGRNVTIFQNVTLGGARVGDGANGNYPSIGDDTTIFAGCVVVGDISVGRNCTIGANSVVLHDVPDNSVAVGAPARVVRTNVTAHEVFLSNEA
jgi:serine O-acetyltransferase